MTATLTPLQTVRLQKTTDGSHKEYVIALDYPSGEVTVAWGRIGYANQFQTRTFDHPDLALEWAEAKQAEKLDKGYVQVDDETAAAPLECAMTAPRTPAAVPADDERQYLVTAHDCYGAYLGLQSNGQGGWSGAQITGSAALVAFLLTTRTGWFAPVDSDEPAVRNRIAGFTVWPVAGGAAMTYTRRDGQVLNAHGVAL